MLFKASFHGKKFICSWKVISQYSYSLVGDYAYSRDEKSPGGMWNALILINTVYLAFILKMTPLNKIPYEDCLYAPVLNSVMPSSSQISTINFCYSPLHLMILPMPLLGIEPSLAGVMCANCGQDDIW